jgi:hypothetical protein
VAITLVFACIMGCLVTIACMAIFIGRTSRVDEPIQMTNEKLQKLIERDLSISKRVKYTDQIKSNRKKTHNVTASSYSRGSSNSAIIPDSGSSSIYYDSSPSCDSGSSYSDCSSSGGDCGGGSCD